MRFQTLLVVLACLQVQIAAFGQPGQKLTYLPSPTPRSWFRALE